MGLYGSPELPPTNEVPNDYWKTCRYCGHIYPRTYKVCPKCNDTGKDLLSRLGVNQDVNASAQTAEEKTTDTDVLFKQSGVLDLSALYASNRFIFSTFNKTVFTIWLIYFCSYGIVNAIIKNNIIDVIPYLFIVIIVLIVRSLTKTKFYAFSSQRLLENFGKKEVRITSFFEREKLVYRIEENERKIDISHISKAYFSHDYVLLYTKGRQLFYIFANELTGNEVNELANYLAERNIKIKKLHYKRSKRIKPKNSLSASKIILIIFVIIVLIVSILLLWLS